MMFFRASLLPDKSFSLLVPSMILRLISIAIYFSFNSFFLSVKRAMMYFDLYLIYANKGLSFWIYLSSEMYAFYNESCECY